MKSSSNILFNEILVYHISFDKLFFNTCYDYLTRIIDMDYKSLLLLFDYISKKISSNAMDNIWVKRLIKLFIPILYYIWYNLYIQGLI